MITGFREGESIHGHVAQYTPGRLVRNVYSDGNSVDKEKLQ